MRVFSCNRLGSESRASGTRTYRRRLLFDHFWRWTRACCSCRTLIGPIDVFCRDCFDHLIGEINSEKALLQPGYALPIYALLTWRDVNEALIRLFIHGFKGGYAAAAARGLCERLAWARSASADLKTVFLYPARRDRSHDHGWLLAWTMTELMPGSAAFALELEEDVSASHQQKHLGLGERSRRKFIPASDEILSICASERVRCVFIDDVVTSAATALAAYIAAGEPRHFEVWTLAARARRVSP